jgi:hypothetical protein
MDYEGTHQHGETLAPIVLASVNADPPREYHAMFRHCC